MTISQKIGLQLDTSSWIRRMFDEGRIMKEKFGPDRVFDFSLGNPLLDPPEEFYEALRKFLAKPPSGRHRYMDNLGWQETREKVARYLKDLWGLPFSYKHIALTVGAAGALCVILKTLLDPGEEVIICAPYFSEYTYYVEAQGGRSKAVRCDCDFNLDLQNIEKALSPHTRAIIINSPNNPTGRIYSEEILNRLGQLLKEKSRAFGKAIYLISDEPYRDLIYTNEVFPPPILSYPHTISITSFSKSLSIAGERIGYLAIHPEMDDGERFISGVKLATRVLGFVNAPSLMQQVLPSLLGVSIDLNFYRANRDLLVSALREIGYQFPLSEGGFYLFPQSPGEDEIPFVQFLKDEYHILTVPGGGFGWRGAFRISYSVSREIIERSLSCFKKALEEFRN